MQPLNETEVKYFYLSIVPTIRTIARKHGYAIGVHGSLVTDLDLIAVPWTEEASEQEELVAEVAKTLNCRYEGHINPPEERAKPHGRQAWTLIFRNIPSEKTGMAYIDLSITPKL